MHRLLILLFGMISTLAVGALLVVLYRYADGEVHLLAQKEEPLGRLPKHGEPQTPKESWLKKLARKQKPDFSYAVTELEIALPLLQKPSVKKEPAPYVIRRMDEYKMFCLRQILEREKCRYVLYRKKNAGVLILHETDKKRLRKIMEKLREFEISMQKDNG